MRRALAIGALCALCGAASFAGARGLAYGAIAAWVVIVGVGAWRQSAQLDADARALEEREGER